MTVQHRPTRTAAGALALTALLALPACGGSSDPEKPGAPTQAADPGGTQSSIAGTPTDPTATTSAAPTSSTPSTSSAMGSSTTSAHPTAAPTAGSPAATDPANRCASTLVSRLTPEQRAGQLVMIGLDASWQPSELDDDFATSRAGNVVLLGGWSGGADSVRAATSHLQARAKAHTGGIPLLIAADQEGGTVQQLRGPGFTRLPKAAEQSQRPAPALRGLGRTIGSELSAAGINLNLAPVADTVPASLGTGNEPIGKWGRQYANDPAGVSTAIAQIIPGLHDGRVGATIKHFPGLGRVRQNTDFSASGITDDTTGPGDAYLQPFHAGISAGADIVMMSSAHYPRLDPSNQALFSHSIITGVLRGQMGWTGVVATDDVDAQAVAGVPVSQRAMRFLDAGGDLVLTGRPRDAGPMTQAIVARAASDPAFAAKVDQSAVRVVSVKVRRGVVACGWGRGER